jgi:hypothetical protein
MMVNVLDKFKITGKDRQYAENLLRFNYYQTLLLTFKIFLPKNINMIIKNYSLQNTVYYIT